MRAMKRATIKQVASEAQVSTQTVSRVINGRPDVSPETRIRVQQVIERLSYQPSAVARSLIGRRTYTLGVVASGLQYFGPSSTLTGIEKQAADSGFSVLLTLIHEPHTEEIEPVLSDMLSRQVEGIIRRARRPLSLPGRRRLERRERRARFRQAVRPIPRDGRGICFQRSDGPGAAARSLDRERPCAGRPGRSRL